MKVFIKGKGSTILSKNLFIASGGQADIYANGNTAYKIYSDKKFLIPENKIKELSALSFKNIIKPEDILLDQNNNNIGYTMTYVKDTWSLCQLFPKAFRDRNSLSHEMVLKLIRRLQETVDHCHKHNILIVDLNELNFLVAKDFSESYFIDVDSYQTSHYPATAIMDSIRDRQVKNNKFTENSDWFSFAITSFQLFSGLHPFKGTHLTYKTLDERMNHNISVLNKDVKVPRVCYDLNIIPKVYLDWFKSIFEDGKRLPPPTDLVATAIINTVIQKISGSNSFDIEELESFSGTIVDLLWSNPKVILTSSGIYLNKVLDKDVPAKAKFTILPKNNNLITAWVNFRSLKLRNSTNRSEIKLDIEVEDIFNYDNRIYIKNNSSILELKLMEIGQNIIASTSLVAQILGNSTKIFDGCAIQNLLGAVYISIFPQSGLHYQFHIPELDKFKLVDAKFEKNVLMVIGNKYGKYDKFIFRFDLSWNGQYDLRIINDIEYLENNFTILDSGNVVHLLGDEKLEIFSSKKDSKNIKEIVDKAVSGDMKLCHDGPNLIFAKDDKVFSMKMKP
jgi:serine/threonine protein kinase